MKLKLGFVALLVIAVAAVGCKKSVKGEENRWKSASAKADELAVLYPAFKPAIEKQKAAAKTIYDAAQGIDDEKAKIAKLSEANKTLDGGFMSQLAGVDDEIKKLREMLVDAAGAKVDEAERRRLTQGVAEVEKTMKKVDGLLAKGAADSTAAVAVMNQVTKELTSARGLLGKVMPTPEPPPTATATGAADQPPAAPATWTCEYCDHVNEPEATSCGNCGAAKPAAK